MRSVSGINWEEININNRILEKVKSEKNFSEIVSKIIISRNFDKTEVNSIKNDTEIFNPFFKNNDFNIAHKILEKSIINNEKILILGDYDVDGCVSSSLLINLFKLINYKSFSYFIPNRFKDGYGASLNLIKKLIKKKPKLIIFVDCGSNSIDAINFLNSQKVKTIIIDHHEIYKPYPKSDCIINPKKNCDYNEFDYFCSSTLTYFFIDLIIKKKELKFNFSKNLIYLLLAIVADVMPLRKLHRIIAIYVINNLSIKDFFFIK